MRATCGTLICVPYGENCMYHIFICHNMLNKLDTLVWFLLLMCLTIVFVTVEEVVAFHALYVTYVCDSHAYK